MITNKVIYAAGVLFYSKSVDKTIYFLLGKDVESNRWSNFSGNAELTDKGDIEITAARECWEETLGSVMDYDDLKSKIKYSKGTNYVTSKTPSGKFHYLFLVKIPFLNTYRDKFTSTKKFVSRLNIDSKYLEISDIKWVSLDTINQSIENSKSLIKLRGSFEDGFKKNIVEILNHIN